jgi:hypothetical protein
MRKEFYNLEKIEKKNKTHMSYLILFNNKNTITVVFNVHNHQ